MVLDGAHVAVGWLLECAHLPHDHPKAKDVSCCCHLHMTYIPLFLCHVEMVMWYSSKCKHTMM